MTRTNREVWQKKWDGRDEPVNVMAKELLQTYDMSKGRKLLDVGCGNGTDSLLFAEHGFDVTATDFSESGVRILLDRAKDLTLHIDARLHNTEERFPWDDGSFDVIYAHLALHYFDHATTMTVFREMRRLLKVGGSLFVKCKSTKDCLYGIGERVGPDMYLSDHLRHFFTPEYLREVLAPFHVLTLKESSSAYHGKISAFVEAHATTK